MLFSNTDPRVSVIMSAFNNEKDLSSAIRSILTQTYANFEFFIIDDFSEDKSPDIIQYYAKKDTRIKYLQNKNTIGLTKNLNRMIGISKGKYIARMDADEISIQSRFEEQVNILNNNPEYNVVASWYMTIDEDDNEIARIKLSENKEYSVDDFIEKGPRFCHGSVMIRKNALEKIGGYREEFRYAQDLDLWLRMAATNRFYIIPKFLYKRRLSLGMIEKTKIKRFYAACAKESAIKRRKEKEDCLETFTDAEKHFPKRPFSNRERKANYYYLKSIYRKIGGQYLNAQKDLLNAILIYPFSIRFWFRIVLNIFPSTMRNRIVKVIQILLEKRILLKYTNE